MGTLADQIAKYEIQIVRTGDGAMQAAKEFAATDVAAARASHSGGVLNESLHKIHETSLLGRNGLHSLNGVLLLAGEHHFPVVTESIMTAHGAMGVLRGTAAATGASLGSVGLIAAGVAVAVYALTKAWQAHESAIQASEAEKRLEEQMGRLKHITEDHINLLREKNKISDDEQVKLIALLDLDVKRAATEVLRLQGSKEENDAVEKLKKLRGELTLESVDGVLKERVAAQQLYQQRKEEIQDLAKQAGGQYTPGSAQQMLYANREAYEARVAQIDKQRMAEDTNKDLKKFETDLSIHTLQETNNRINIAEQEYTARIQHYKELYDSGKITEEKLVELNQEALQKKLQAEQKVHLHIMSLREMEVSTANQFASGLSGAIVAFANSTKSAKDAFKDFFISFLSQIAQMIIQTEILAGVKAVAGLAGGGSVTADAGGGVHYAAAGLSGVYSVARPTYFPKFNVVAGEAGREMLTVLARPRMMSLGGVEAVVGNAGRNQLAIANANDLAGRGGGGGRLVIELQHSEQARAEIIQQSIQGAEVYVTQKMGTDSRLRETTKKAVR